MWQRLTRVVRSFIGFFISVAEDPELILQQNIRDMNDQVPRMNESIAMVKANVTLLEKEEAKYKNDLAGLTAKVKAAIQANRDDLAGAFAAQLRRSARRRRRSTRSPTTVARNGRKRLPMPWNSSRWRASARLTMRWCARLKR
jgi:phage shock protein A